MTDGVVDGVGGRGTGCGGGGEGELARLRRGWDETERSGLDIRISNNLDIFEAGGFYHCEL